MNLALILFIGGIVILLWLALWSRQRQRLGTTDASVDALLRNVPLLSTSDAVLVAKTHGRLLYANEAARQWLNLEGDPDLETIARLAQPADSFLELFAQETQISFQIGGRWVEASSHSIPSGDESRTVVVMRELAANTANPEALDLAKAINIVNEIGETINASMGVEQAMQALLSIVRKGVPATAGEISLWDAEQQILNPRGWVGDVGYVLALAEAGGTYAEGEGISGWIARHRKPVLVSNRDQDAAVRPKLANSAYQSFVAVPLLLGDRFIGTFELASDKPAAFSQGDLSLLQSISKQVATSIYNAELYTEQSRRIEDLANLQEVSSNREEDADAIYTAVTERVARLLGADMCGILLYDERKQALVAQPPFFGLPLQVVRSYAIPVPEGTPQHDIWERHTQWLSNDLTDEPMAEDMRLTLLINAAGMYNIVLMPLQIGSRRIGMIQVSNKRSHGGFTMHDVRTLRLLASQVAVIVEDIRLVQQEQRRDTEMIGLQEITHAFGALAYEGEFFATTNERIARLMGVSMCGILIHDEDNQRLVPQLPFFGVSDEVIEHYAIPLLPGSPFNQIWLEEDYWYTNNALTDKVVVGGGLSEVAAAIGVNKTLVASLASGGRKLGIVQISNKINGEDFTEKDARLMLIFAAQVAGMIENSRLFREATRRAEESDSLRRVAELAGQVLSTEDSFQPALAEIALLMQSEGVFINVLDQGLGSLITYPRNVYGAELAEPIVQNTYQKGFENSVAISRQPLISNDVPNETEMLASYRAVTNQMNILKTVLVPLAVGEQTLGELGVMNRLRGDFSREDARTLSAIAIQIAAALDRIRLYEATGQNLSRRLQELDAISRVSNELAQTLDLEPVLDVIREEVVRATDADGSTIALLVHTDELREADKPQLDRRLGDRKPASGLADIEIEAIRRRGEPVIIEDYAAQSSDVQMKGAPDDARSAVAAAFSYGEEVVGVIHLYHRQPNHFDDRATTFLVTLAAKASLSYGNNLRYLENKDRSDRLRRRVEQLNQIFELGQMLQNNVDPVTMLEAIAYSVQQSCGFDVVVMSLTENGVLRRITQAGLPLEVFNQNKDKVLPQEQLQELFAKDEFRISESYFLPIDKLSQWYSEGLEVFATTFTGARTLHPRGRNDWREGDMLLVPMWGAGGEPLGVMTVDRPFEGKRPDRNTIEILEIFAHQAASTIENTRLYSASVRSAEQEAQLNEVLEAISSTLDLNQIVGGVVRGVMQLLPFTRMSIALLDSEQPGFDMIRVTITPDDALVMGRDRAASLEGTALGRTFEEEQDYLYHDGDGFMQQYDDLRSQYAEGERTSLILPLITGGLCLGAMHLGTNLMQAFGFEEFRPLLRRIANLTAVAVQNARLFNHAVNLRFFNESVFQSIQQGILVVDRDTHVLTVNEYMRRHFGWNEEAVGQPLFSYRPELQPLLGQMTAKVLDGGTPQELLNQSFVVGENTLVQDFYLYPLLSADSVRGMVILIDDVTQRTQLERDLASRAEQLSAISDVSSRITAALNREEINSLALDEMKRVIGYDVAVSWKREGPNLVMEAVRGVDLSLAPVPISEHDRLHRVVEMRHAITISRLNHDSLPGGLRTRSWLGVPLMNQGSVIGMLTLGSFQPDFYTEQSQQAVQAFANQMAVALVNADLFQDAQVRTQRLSLLNRVSLSLAHSLDTENILEVGLREIAGVLGIERARAYLFERDVNVARLVVEYPRGDFPPSGTTDVMNHPTLRHVWRVPEPLLVPDVASSDEDAMHEDVRKELIAREVTAYALLPMTVGGQTIGAFEMEYFNGAREFDMEKLDLSLIIANQAAIAVLNANLLEQTLVRTRELETMLEAAQATSVTLDLQDVFNSVVRLTLQALDMDDCAIMMYDNVEEILTVELDINRNSDETRIVPVGTEYDLFQYPSKTRALREGTIIVIRREDPKVTDRKELEEMRANGDLERMLVPLVVHDQAIGLIQIDLQSPLRTFSHREIRMAQALGAQAAIAIENARLSTETSAQVEQSLIINELSREISATMDIPSMIRTVRDQIPSLTSANELYLALYNAETGEIVFPMALQNKQEFQMPSRTLGNDEVSYIIRNRRPLLIGGDNPSADEVRRNLKIVNGEGDITRYLGVPLIAGDQVVGVLAIRDNLQTRPFGLNDQRILTTIGTQLGAAIQNANLFRRISNFADELNVRVEERTLELQQERDRLDALYRITAELGRTLDMDRVLDRALDMVTRAIGADEGVVLLVDPETDQLYMRAVHSPMRGNKNGHSDKSHPAERFAAWLVRNEHVAMVDDLRDVEYWDSLAPDAGEWRGALGVVLEANEEVQGVMVFLSRQAGIFTEAQLKLVTAAANQVSAAINNADLYNLIRDQAERMSTLLRAEQEEAQKNSAILEGIADGVVLADANGVIILFNGAAERILNVRRDYVMGQPLNRIGLYGGGSTQWVQALDEWMHNPQHRQSDELILDRLDLGPNIVSIHASPVYTGDQVLGTVSVFRDVTKDVEVDRMKSEFISNVSHELRTPMTSIKGYADLMLMGAVGEVSEQQQKFLQTIKSNADRLSYLVNDLLNISKIDAGTERLKLEIVPVEEVIQHTINSLKGRAEFDRKQIAVSSSVDPLVPSLLADRSKLTQVIQNLLDNAFNYTYPGGTIEVNAEIQPGRADRVLISVKDTGIGIPEAFQARIWNRFERYEEHALVMDVAGTGLGLSIVKTLVEMQNGEIWFESVENKGTTFYVSLPIQRIDTGTPDTSLPSVRQQTIEG